MSGITNNSHLAQASVPQVKDLVRHHLQAIWRDQLLANAVPPLMLWGPPGVGKSAAISEVTQELGVGFIDVRLAQREPVDIRGLPVPREDGVHWVLSAEWPRNPTSRGVILTALDSHNVL